MVSLPFNETDYRSVIRHWVAGRPHKGRGEMKIIAELLKIPTSVLSQILSGQREMNEDQAFLISDHFGFVELEREYFICLVQIARAGHYEYKNHLKQKLVQLREKSQNLSTRLEHENVLSEKDQAEFYSSWIYSAVRLFCGIGAGKRLDDVCQEFHIERERAIRILNFLLSAGLVKLENNLYKMGPSRTRMEKTSSYVSRHHTNWRIKAIERSQNLKENELMFTGPMTISQKDFQILRDKMIGLIQEVSDQVKDSNSEILACFNLDFIMMK
jgi:uncharacterized protein (TIGR02147 family)